MDHHKKHGNTAKKKDGIKMDVDKHEIDYYRKLNKHDEFLIRLTLDKEEEKPKPKQRPKIYIPIDWKHLGMTKKERDEINE